MRLKTIRKLFDKGNVLVFGLRGRGKDVLFGNIIARKKKKYISNMDYTSDERFIPFNPSEFDCGRNTYKDFIDGTIKPYTFPYPRGTDLYISDVGIYFPSQYCNELNKDFKYFPTFFALSRQLGANVFINVQALPRCWDKIREQSDVYVRCDKCHVFFGKLVLMHVTLYDRYESAVRQVEPFSLKLPLLRNKESRMAYDLEKQRYYQNNGKVKGGWLLFINKSKHDTLYFDKLLKGDDTIENPIQNC